MGYKDDREKLTAWVPLKIAAMLKRKADENGRTLSSEIRMALAAWVAK